MCSYSEQSNFILYHFKISHIYKVSPSSLIIPTKCNDDNGETDCIAAMYMSTSAGEKQRSAAADVRPNWRQLWWNFRLWL